MSESTENLDKAQKNQKRIGAASQILKLQAQQKIYAKKQRML